MKRKTQLLATILFYFSSAIIPAYSEETTIELEPIEVSSSRLKTTKEKYAGSITIINEDEIKKSGFKKVEDVLRDQLSIGVFKQGGVGGESSIRMRGADQKSVLVIIDGMRVNGNTTGAFDFRNLDTANIERIEILRGSQTVLWGADAVGGVINIITKKGQGTPFHTMSFEAGSFGTYRETLGSSGTVDDIDYSISVSRTDIAGYSDFNENRINESGGIAETDSFGNTNITSRISTNFWGDGQIEIAGGYALSYSDLDTTSGDREFRDTEIERFNIAIPVSKDVIPGWRIKFTPSMAYEYSNVDQETTNEDIFSRTYIADLQNNIDINDYFSTAFGLVYRAQNGRNNRRGFSRNTFTQGYFFQGQFDWEDTILLTAGFRKDISDTFEDPLTYKFEAAYKFKQWDLRVRGAYATGFRAPTFNELSFPNFGNPNIQPEKSESFEVGMDKNLFNKIVRLELTFFNINFDPLITGNPVENVSKAKSRGIEAHVGVDLPFNLYLSNNYTWTEAINDINDIPLSRVAKHQYSATLSHSWKDKIFSQLGIRARSGVLDNSSGSRTVPGFATLRAAIRYKLNKSIEINVRGENLIDKEYEEIARRGTTDAAGYAGFTYKFN